MNPRRRRAVNPPPPTMRMLLLAVGITTPVGILVVNGSAFVMHHLSQFRLGIATCAFVSSLFLNGLTASWLLRLARRRAIPVYLAHPEWAVVLATVVVIAASGGAAYFTFLGMRDPTRLPDLLAVVTATLALLVPLAFTYVARRLARPLPEETLRRPEPALAPALEVGADLPELGEEPLAEG